MCGLVELLFYTQCGGFSFYTRCSGCLGQVVVWCISNETHVEFTRSVFLLEMTARSGCDVGGRSVCAIFFWDGGACVQEPASKQPLSLNNLSLLSWEGGRGTSLEEIGVRGQRMCSLQLQPKCLFLPALARVEQSWPERPLTNLEEHNFWLPVPTCQNTQFCSRLFLADTRWSRKSFIKIGMPGLHIEQTYQADSDQNVSPPNAFPAISKIGIAPNPEIQYCCF